MTDLLLLNWSQAANDLGLEIDAPFTAPLPSGKRALVRLRLRNFGAVQGMLVVTDAKCIEDIAEELWEAGYGYSVLSVPSRLDRYERESFVEMLRDWGWTGPANSSPPWY